MSDNTAIALGDPVGPEAEIGATAREFLEMCRENGWTAAFYQTLPDFLPVYGRLRLKRLKIGDDAMVDLPHFSLEGKSKRELRSKVRQFEVLGIHSREFEPPVVDAIIEQLKVVQINGCGFRAEENAVLRSASLIPITCAPTRYSWSWTARAAFLALSICFPSIRAKSPAI